MRITAAAMTLSSVLAAGACNYKPAGSGRPAGQGAAGNGGEAGDTGGGGAGGGMGGLGGMGGEAGSGMGGTMTTGSGGMAGGGTAGGPPLPPVPDGGFDADPGGECSSTKAEGTIVRQPVDVIVVIDNSRSMTDEIQAVEQNIAVSFAEILGMSGIDYRVILVSRHGAAQTAQSICIPTPLSGATSCMPPPAQPMNGTNFFHYSVEIESTDSLRKILDTYRTADEFGLAPQGWSEWLRPDARKVFLEITDDESVAVTPVDFDAQLLAMDSTMFGAADMRKYVFHSIVGLMENDPPTMAWDPTQPIQTELCMGNGADVVTPGVSYQELSILTGGLRFPICQFTSFDSVFQAIATEVVTGSRIACEFDVPPPPMGRTLDLTKVAISYIPGSGGAPETFNQAATAAACVPDAFYIDAGRIRLCPETCTKVQADGQAQVEVVFTCQSTIIIVP